MDEEDNGSTALTADGQLTVVITSVTPTVLVAVVIVYIWPACMLYKLYH